MWTAPELASEARSLSSEAWRVVESQSQVATMKLVDSLDEQAILEAELDRSKPAIPLSCVGLDYLLATPFRYAPYPSGSRFRRSRQRDGCFYCSEHVETAIAEAAFYHVAFFLASPGTPFPVNPQERTAFQIPIRTTRAVDLTVPPFAQHHKTWTDPIDYAHCQAFADKARDAGIEAICYESVRDPAHGANLALLSPKTFASRAPTSYETWRLLLRRDRVDVVREMPKFSTSFRFSTWAAIDPRIPDVIRSA